MASTTGLTGQRARPARNARYLLVCTAGLGFWYGINFWPGWQSIPVLTEAAAGLLPLLNLWLLAVVVSNAVYIVFDAPWFKSASQIFVTTASIALAAKAYTDFPFDFSMFYYYDFDWIAGLALMAAVVGGLIRLVVLGIRFVRAATRGMDDYLWIRKVRNTLEAKTYMAALARPLAPAFSASAGPGREPAGWADRSDGIARTVAGDPSSNTLARFAELGGVLEEEPAPPSEASTLPPGTEAGDDRRGRRAAHALSTSAKIQLPRLGRRKVGSHAAR